MSIKTGLKPLTFRADLTMVAELDAIAASKSVGRSSLIRDAVTAYLANETKQLE
jgi:metal-responsive CopG/Arc/MetJ family transcriptional regulator